MAQIARKRSFFSKNTSFNKRIITKKSLIFAIFTTFFPGANNELYTFWSNYRRIFAEKTSWVGPGQPSMKRERM